MKTLYAKLVAFLGSRLCFWSIWLLSIFQSGWIAVSARYPMAFDEAYHLDLIKLHASQWNPLLTSQPPGPAPYGALTRDPSFLYHYILSFPYRLLRRLNANEYTTIVSLRFISIAMFAIGLLLFRRLLLETRASKAAVNAALFFFIMIPTVPLLAGQMNYDNLQFPLFALGLLLAIKVGNKVRIKQLDTKLVLATLVVCLIGTLVKFTFLPILTGIVLYFAFLFCKYWLKNPNVWWNRAKKDWQKISALQRRVLMGGLAISASLFVWYYAVNIIVYKNPVIQCNQVLSTTRCQANDPWARNYRLAHQKKQVNHNPLTFSLNWLGGMQYRLFFVINGAKGPQRYVNHTAPAITGVAGLLAAFGTLLFLRYGKRMLNNDPVLVAILGIVGVYVLALWGRNYHDYLQLGQMVAINGRYLQPILLPIILVFVASFQWAFRRMPAAKLSILAVAILFFLSGGGVTGFIHYSTANWYFEQQHFILSMNNFAKKLVAPLFL